MPGLIELPKLKIAVSMSADKSWELLPLTYALLGCQHTMCWFDLGQEIPRDFQLVLYVLCSPDIDRILRNGLGVIESVELAFRHIRGFLLSYFKPCLYSDDLLQIPGVMDWWPILPSRNQARDDVAKLIGIKNELLSAPH
ncbi:MAG: hypothetical protein WC451_03745 [Patescibacteria group bacterium]